MGLFVDIRINFAGIGRVSIVRIDGCPGEMCRYTASAWTLPHPTTGEEVAVSGIEVDHHYDASPLELVEKAVAAINARRRRDANPIDRDASYGKRRYDR